MKQTLKELTHSLTPQGRILAVEPRMHVSKAGFETMLRYAEKTGLKAVDYPKRSGGRSVVWSA